MTGLPPPATTVARDMAEGVPAATGKRTLGGGNLPRKKKVKGSKKMLQKQRRNEPLKEESRSVAAKTGGQQALFFMQHLAASTSASVIEREEFKLKGSAFKTADYLVNGAQQSGGATDQQEISIAKLAVALRSPYLSRKPVAVPQKCGSPRVICVSDSALRAVDVARAFAPVKCGVSKLFGKHFKEQEQADYLSTSTAMVAVGTPHRLHRLCASGGLKLDSLALLIIDMKPNVKGATIFDQKQLSYSLATWYREHIHVRVAANQVKICFSGA